MLLSMEVDLIPKKRSCKWNLVWPNSSNYSKIVLILLIEVITFYMKPTIIDMRGIGLEFVLK